MRTWYKNQTLDIQLVLIFIFNFMLWGLIYFVYPFIWDEDSKTWKVILVQALIMAVTWTLTFNWKLTRQVFSRRKDTIDDATSA